LLVGLRLGFFEGLVVVCCAGKELKDTSAAATKKIEKMRKTARRAAGRKVLKSLDMMVNIGRRRRSCCCC
jgi:hypothetical protein